MSIKITYFVHGTTTDNEKEISSGWKDVELSELGIKQSIALKEQTKDKKLMLSFVLICNALIIQQNSLGTEYIRLFLTQDFENVITES